MKKKIPIIRTSGTPCLTTLINRNSNYKSESINMKKNKSNKFIYSVLALLFTTFMSANIENTVSTNTYYISPTGNDNAAGTSASAPWQSISKINAMNIAPGSTILFQGGQTFQGSIYFNNLDANDVANKVVLSSYGTGKAIINSGAAAGFYAYNTKGFTLSDLIFTGAGMSSNNTDGIMLYTDLPGNVKLEGITIKNVDVHNYGKVGISIGSGYNNTGYKDLFMDAVHVYDVKQNGIKPGVLRLNRTQDMHIITSLFRKVSYITFPDSQMLLSIKEVEL
jgi:hypothetical protein